MRPPDSEESDQIRNQVGFWIEGVLLPFLGILGILGNIFCVWIFNRKDVELKPSFANLLKCLSAYDTLLLWCMLVQHSLPHLSQEFSIWLLPYITPYNLPLIHIALTGGVYSIVAVAVERFLTVCYPFYNCKMCNGLGYILPLVLFSLCYNIPKFMEVETEFVDLEETVVVNGTNFTHVVTYPCINATDLRRNPLYTKYVVFILNFFVMGLIPVVVLSILNLKIYVSISAATAAHNLISSSHRRENTMAGVLMAVVIMFLCCHTSRIIVNFYVSLEMAENGQVMATPLWLDIVIKVNHLLLTINSGANIIIYSIKDFKFRTILISVFGLTDSLSSCGPTVRSSFGGSRANMKTNENNSRQIAQRAGNLDGSQGSNPQVHV